MAKQSGLALEERQQFVSSAKYLYDLYEDDDVIL
jgi:hypothetical protein